MARTFPGAVTSTSSARASRVSRICVMGLWGALLLWVAPVQGQNEAAIPHLRSHGTATELIVHGKPFLMLGGELVAYLQKNKDSLTEELHQAWSGTGMITSGTWE